MITYSSLRSIFCLSLLLLDLLGDVSAAHETSLLMVGNSFTDANGLEEMIQALLEEDYTFVTNSNVYAMRFKRGNSNFVEHAANTELRSAIQERPWTWVVLQEQSEKPGFWDTAYESEWIESLQALDVLNGWVRKQKHSEMVLFMTWARRHEDPYNPDIFPDFPTMQSKVAEGYYRMQQRVSTHERPVPIAPVGLAFQTIHDWTKPTTDGTAFSNLYADDGIHPSVQGTYLAACVIYATMTGRHVTHLKYAPPGIGKKVRKHLQHAAMKTVRAFEKSNAYNRWARRKYRRHRDPHKTNHRPYHAPDEDQESSHHGLVVIGSMAFVGCISLYFRSRLNRQLDVLSERRQRGVLDLVEESSTFEFVELPNEP